MSDEPKEIAEPLDDGLVKDSPPEDDVPIPRRKKEPIEKTLLTQEKKPEQHKWEDGLSTGSTLLNLACSGLPTIGFLRGGFYYFVGDSSSGKSFCVLTCLAEAANNPKYDNYQLIYDAPEDGAQMDFVRFFGNKMATRLQPPEKDEDSKPIYSSTLESFYFHTDTVLNKGPAIYVLDSMDALTTMDDEDKFDEQKAAYEKGKETSGSYGTSKAKLNSGLLRVIFNRLRDTGSILLVISQTRDRIGFGAQFNPRTRSGGRALTFYAHLELWSSILEHLTVTHNTKEREQGIVCEVHIKKNRLTGRNRKVKIPIYHSYGIDDIGSCIDYLIEEKHWIKSNGGVIEAIGFDNKDLKGRKETLVQKIQEGGLENQLREIVAKVWNSIEEAVSIERKPRYQ